MRSDETELEALDRSSYVPLYIQLQEVLKQRLESGVWAPSETFPSEPMLAEHFGVSRNVVRQALAILEDDGEIIRIRGRGTFVAQPKFEFRAGGLSRLLVEPRTRDLTIEVIESKVLRPEASIRRQLDAAAGEEVLNVLTLALRRDVPFALFTSNFRRADVEWLEHAARPGESFPPDITLADHGIELGRSNVAIETTRTARFESERFGVEPQATALLVTCTEYQLMAAAERPFEAARAEYRADILQFQLALSPDNQRDLAATVSLSDGADDQTARR